VAWSAFNSATPPPISRVTRATLNAAENSGPLTFWCALRPLNYCGKATITRKHMKTGTPAWAGELVATAVQDFLASDMARTSAFAALASRALVISFERGAGTIKIPGRASPLTLVLAPTVPQEGVPDVRFGSKADMAALFGDVRFTPESGHGSERDGCPLSANSGHFQITR
jgi:hypothetical protein